MSNLPHPLGDTNANDMFYPGTPSVTVADLAGPAGSRAVEFGEDGTSLAVNRGLYALAKNEEYIQARMEQDIARPELVTFMPSGGSGGSYTFSLDVWCGDTAYTPEDQNVRNGLISVLDENYNDLTDPTSGDQVVVKEILDAPAGSSQVGAGFITNPHITFRKMNPITGALGADYQIPDGVKVWLAFGQKAQLDELVGGSSGSLQDAWFRGFTRSIGEIHAASFLYDGSRKASGNFDMDGNAINNIATLQNVDTNPVVLRGTGAAGHVDFYSDDLVRFRDQYMPSYTPLNDGDTGIYGNHSSLMTSLNGQVKTGEILTGNRPLNRTGSFTSTPTPGLDYPDLDLMVGGEVIKVPAGNINLSAQGTGKIYVFYSPGIGVLALSASSLGSFPDGGILLWSGDWGGASWTNTVDCRWPSHRSSTHEAWFVGDGLGADFTDLTEMQTVLNGGWGSLGRDAVHKTPEIVVVGVATVSDTFYLPTNWHLRGVGNPNSALTAPRVETTSSFPTSADVISCGQRNTIRDLRVVWGNTSAHQDTDYAGIRTLSAAEFENIQFGDGVYTFWSCIISQDSRITKCDLSSTNYQAYGVYSKGRDRITDCKLGPFSAGNGVACAYLEDGDNVVERCTFHVSGAGTCVFKVRDHNNIIRDCSADFSAISTRPFVLLEEGAGSIIGVTLENNYLIDGYKFVSSAINNASKVFMVKAFGNTLLNFADSNFSLLNSDTAWESSVIVKGNYIGGTLAGHVLAADSCGGVTFVDNTVFGVQDGIEVIGSRSVIQGNTIEASGVGFKTDYANYLTVTGNIFDTPQQSVSIENVAHTEQTPFTIGNNRFLNMGSGYAAIEIRGYSNASITGNVFGTTLSRNGGGILCVPQVGYASNNHTITGNVFRGMAGDSGMAQDAIIDIEEDVGDVPESCVISNNSFELCGRTASSTRSSYCIFSEAHGATINGNVIRDLRGPANTGAKMYGIKSTGSGSTVNGNSIYTDLTDSGVCHGDIIGISVDAGPHVCVGNNIHFTGSGATSTTGYIWGISSSVNDGIVSGNYIHDFDISSAAGQYGIINYNVGCIVNGNLSMRHNIENNTSGGMVLGNVVQGGGAVIPGTNATSGNVP